MLKNIVPLAVALLFGSTVATAQTPQQSHTVGNCPPVMCDTTSQHFDINSAAVPHSPALDKLMRHLTELFTSGRLKAVEVIGSASPDGPLALNDRLALERAQKFRTFMLDNTPIPGDIVTVTSDGENWAYFRQLVEQEAPKADRDKIFAVLDQYGETQTAKNRLKRLDGGRIWQYLAKSIFPHQRSVELITTQDDNQHVSHRIEGDKVTSPEPEPQPTPVPEPEPVVEEVIQEEVIAEPAPAPVVEEGWQRHIYLKTNIPTWGMLIMNVAGEIDLAPHWSFSLPVYYSGFNYFIGHRKFCTFTIQPEGRYWFRAENQGFFLGAHLGMAYYNCAFNGEYRYQDHRGRTPALGGGLNVGYRLQFSKTRRWGLEFSLGYGIYHLDYDKFLNYCDGLQVGRVKRTFYGIDNVAVSLTYRFDIGKKKGGAQ